MGHGANFKIKLHDKCIIIKHGSAFKVSSLHAALYLIVHPSEKFSFKQLFNAK